ncbi:MAG: hypothetical protein WBM41_15450 [Arenicellales bacterium]
MSNNSKEVLELMEKRIPLVGSGLTRIIRLVKCGLISSLLGAATLSTAPATATESQDTELLGVMHRAYDSLSFLVRLALEPGYDRLDEPDVVAKLEQLDQASYSLLKHGQLEPVSFHLFGRSLDQNVQQMLRHYRNGLHDVAELYLLDTIEHCVACHTLLPDDKSRSIGQEFGESLKDTDLNSVLAARILIAIRQPERALESMENYLTQSDYATSELETEEELLDYLWYCLHITADGERPLPILRQVQEKKSTPFYLQRKIGLWIENLDQFADDLRQEPGMNQIRSLYQMADKAEASLTRRDRSIYDIVTSTMINRLLDNNSGLEPQEKSELYFMLAMIHMRMRTFSSSVPTAELYLEASIREAPDSELAKAAYAELEEYALKYYGDVDPLEELFSVPIEDLRTILGIE